MNKFINLTILSLIMNAFNFINLQSIQKGYLPREAKVLAEIKEFILSRPFSPNILPHSQNRVFSTYEHAMNLSPDELEALYPYEIYPSMHHRYPQESILPANLLPAFKLYKAIQKEKDTFSALNKALPFFKQELLKEKPLISISEVEHELEGAKRARAELNKAEKDYLQEDSSKAH